MLDSTSFNETLGPLKDVLRRNLLARIGVTMDRVEVLRQLSSEDKEKLATACESREYPGGSMIIKQGAHTLTRL